MRQTQTTQRITAPPPANYRDLINFLFDLQDMADNDSPHKAIKAFLLMGIEFYGAKEIADYAERIGKADILNKVFNY